MDFMKLVKTYATYSELFGRQYAKSDVQGLIHQLPLGGILDVLSQMCSRESNDDYFLNVFFTNIDSVLPGSGRFFKSKLSGYHVYTHQALLSVWKWMLAYGDKDKLDEGIEIERGIAIVIYLCIIISDYLYDSESNITDEMMRNSIFNNSEDLGSTISRAAYLYFGLAQQRELFEPSEFIDFNTDFAQTKGYTLHEHFSIMFGVLTMFMNKTKKIVGGSRKNVNQIFRDTTIAEKAQLIIEPFTVDFDTAHTWALETIDSNWDFLLFERSMFFKYPDDSIILIHRKLIDKQFFTGTFHIIRHCYTETDTRFLTFFGRPFEIYVANLMESALETKQLPYQYIQEFHYGRGNGKRSPDVMLILGDKLLAIEAKARRIRLDSITSSNNKSGEEEFGRMVLSPLNQLKKCLADLKGLPEGAFLSSINEIYLFSVTQEDFPVLPPLEEEISKNILADTDLPIKNLTHISIEEYEMLCSLISRRKPIFKIIDTKQRIAPHIPFKNYLLHYSFHPRRPTVLHNVGMEFLGELSELLFQYQ